MSKLEALQARQVIKQASAHYGTPEIVNIGPGRQFPATEFIGGVLAKVRQLSMDDRGAWHDKMFVERLCPSVSVARTDNADYKGRLNTHRPHSMPYRVTPDERYQTDISNSSPGRRG